MLGLVCRVSFIQVYMSGGFSGGSKEPIWRFMKVPLMTRLVGQDDYLKCVKNERDNELKVRRTREWLRSPDYLCFIVYLRWWLSADNRIICACYNSIWKFPSSCGKRLCTITCLTKWWTSSHPCLWIAEPVNDAPLIPQHDTITCYQRTSGSPIAWDLLFFFFCADFPSWLIAGDSDRLLIEEWKQLGAFPTQPIRVRFLWSLKGGGEWHTGGSHPTFWTCPWPTANLVPLLIVSQLLWSV